MKKFAFKLCIFKSISIILILTPFPGEQLRKIQTRPHLPLLRQMLLPKIRPKNPHKDPHWIQTAKMQILHETFRGPQQFEQTRATPRRGEHPV